MFHLFSLFSSIGDLPDDETIVDYTKPCAEYLLSGHRLIAVYKTRTRLLITDAMFTWAWLGWVPRRTSPAAIKAAAEMYYRGYRRGFDDYEGFSTYQRLSPIDGSEA